ncbi:hypothetical protein ACEWY4_014563 [Coilia grayii]|uniref:Integrase catalytic domain-containing protein n=1 Tax=Coilia grayii TaxID=363190 RepID=A0ABD1JSL8_9TELE
MCRGIFLLFSLFSARMMLLRAFRVTFVVLVFSVLVSSNEDDIRQFFTDILRCLEGIQRGVNCEMMHGELHYHCQTLSRFLFVVRSAEDLDIIRDMEALNEFLNVIVGSYDRRQRTEADNPHMLMPPTVMTGQQGRPQYSISRPQIQHLLSLGMNWQSIATCLGMSSRTLYRHRQLLGIQPLTYTTMSNEDLNIVVRDILQSTTNAGERYVHGSLRARGIHIQRWRVRISLQEIDPIGRSFRRRRTIRRRIYSVSGPNMLWHIDGNHKLVRWRMVFHGCVDGFSRAIIYLACLNNNRATSVLELFMEGIQAFGMPSRIRCDHGMENTAVARFTLYNRGLNSVITGRSVHNQRIERLWAELNRVVSFHFSNIFQFIEEHNVLDSLNELHLFCLHYIYLPRIQRAATEFQNQWNHHSLSTQGGQTPLQLWQRGIIMTGIGLNDSRNTDSASGIDRPFPDLQTNNNVVVPLLNIEVDETTMNRLRQRFDPFEDDGNQGIDLFCNILNFLQRQS